MNARITPFPPRRDKRIADEAVEDRSGMCSVNGCPNAWSVDAGDGRLCSPHAWSDRMQWPAITQQALDRQTEQALRGSAPSSVRRVDKDEAIAKLRAFRLGDVSPRAWAYSLKAREERGERLTPFQASAWRAALKHLEPQEAIG